MKWIRRDILPNSNTENQEINFKIETQKSKRFIFQPKNVMPQSQKWAPNFSKIDCFRYFELKSIFIRFFVLDNYPRLLLPLAPTKYSFYPQIPCRYYFFQQFTWIGYCDWNRLFHFQNESEQRGRNCYQDLFKEET